MPPARAIAGGALGSWQADDARAALLVHKTANVPGGLDARDEGRAEARFDAFIESDQAKYEKAAQA